MAAALLAPATALAGGTVVVPPLVPKGVDPKAATNLTGLLGSELDFSGAYDTVTELPQAPPSLNLSCVTSTSCLAGIAKAAGADAVLAGTVGQGGAGLQVFLVLYDAKKNTIVRKRTFDSPPDVASIAAAAPKFIREITTGGTGAEEADAAASFTADEEEDFQFEGGGKTKMAVTANPRELSDGGDDEDEDPSAAQRAKAAAEAKAKADADARARADAAARAKADADARARAESEARAQAEADAKAKAERDRLAREDAQKKASAKDKPADADLEAELASFSFGSSSSKAIVVESDDEPPVEEDEPADTRTFSERYASSSKVTEELDEPAPAPKKAVAKSRPAPAEYDEDDPDAPSEFDRLADDDDEYDAPPARRVATSDDDEDLDEPTRRRSTVVIDDGTDKPGVGLAFRAGGMSYDALVFVTYGVELAVPVAGGLHIVAGIEGASTNRQYTDAQRQAVADDNGIDKDDVQDWNMILPMNVGAVYKAAVGIVHPYGGLDLSITPYTPDFQVAVGARARGGADFMFVDSFGVNADLALGFLAGDQFETIQKDLPAAGFFPEGRVGAVLVF